MTIESSLENILIYYDNLSLYYVGSVIITLISVVLAWWYNKNKVEVTNEEETQQNRTNNCSKLDQRNESEEEESDTNDDIISKIKSGRQTLLSEEVSKNMTEDQLKEEKEVERQQLEAIFQLLQSEEDKFQVTSLEELEDQLKLYRH